MTELGGNMGGVFVVIAEAAWQSLLIVGGGEGYKPTLLAKMHNSSSPSRESFWEFALPNVLEKTDFKVPGMAFVRCLILYDRRLLRLLLFS
jgi:hypothetical protein